MFYDLGVARRKTMKKAIHRSFADESGITTVEYAVGGALIGIAIIAAFTALSGSIAGALNLLDAILPG